MGTFLGNLQVLNATQDQVSALMPGALVGRWSERFVTVLDDTFGLGAVDGPARRLSKKLPQAAVLSVGLADSDLLELAVWRDGKRLTVRAHFPYDGVSKKGDPKKFCQAFDLPPEDEKRLKAVWAKGDAEEQLELTAALLGTPLWAKAEYPPEKPMARDADEVDEWLAQRPDPPRVKNRTRAQVLQELAGFCPAAENFLQEKDRRTFRLNQLNERGGHTPWEDLVLHAGPDGRLEEWPEWEEDVRRHTTRFEVGIPRTTVEILERGGRSLSMRVNWEQSGQDGVSPESSVIIRDSWGMLPCPLAVTPGRINDYVLDFQPLADGGVVLLLPGRIVCCGPDGARRWRRQGDRLGPLCGGLLWLGWTGIDPTDGQEAARVHCQHGGLEVLLEVLNDQDRTDELWMVESAFDQDRGKMLYFLLRLDQKGVLLQKAPLPAYLAKDVGGLVFLRDRILFFSYHTGLWLLDRDTLAVLNGIVDHRAYEGAALDGAGRLWVQVGGSTLEAYDQDLNLLSRHRLKGEVFSRYLDNQGRLCAVTYSECKGKHNVAFDSEGNLYTPGYDKNKEIVRVYRLA